MKRMKLIIMRFVYAALIVLMPLIQFALLHSLLDTKSRRAIALRKWSISMRTLSLLAIIITNSAATLITIITVIITATPQQLIVLGVDTKVLRQKRTLSQRDPHQKASRFFAVRLFCCWSLSGCIDNSHRGRPYRKPSSHITLFIIPTHVLLFIPSLPRNCRVI